MSRPCAHGAMDCGMCHWVGGHLHGGHVSGSWRVQRLITDIRRAQRLKTYLRRGCQT